ncbi:uncharacterized protein TNCV_596031 [Trichonephila clavipes]|uniref:CCHC-type domain-containing protein n=1 Tax=Trichonephila clavipes TaxID=2585209 RepID=A0A8X6UZ62_TRICX|nr:uncharacterized protein TNCV_596031 [Trichonephila clavipes]
METLRKCKQACVDALKQMPDHYPEEPFFVRALTELQEIEETISMAKLRQPKNLRLKTLGYLSVRVEGYDGRGVTQCYTCNKFNHTSENCHLNPRCLKCGENHITRDCPLKQKLETAYCINCNIYGHMANYRGCPSFPKPPKEPPKTIGTPTLIFTTAWLGQTSLMPKQQPEQITQLTPTDGDTRTWVFSTN